MMPCVITVSNRIAVFKCLSKADLVENVKISSCCYYLVSYLRVGLAELLMVNLLCNCKSHGFISETAEFPVVSNSLETFQD